ncbi:MAG: glutaredoxin family protein [Chloroflexota bacterium]
MKEFLSQKGVAYVERDVATDAQAMAELVELGYMTTPVIRVDDEVVVGFNRKRLEQILGLESPEHR